MSQSILASRTPSPPYSARSHQIPPGDRAHAQQAESACPHGLRPGTTVCLHCLREKRLETRRRRYRMAARIGLATASGAVVIALVVGTLKSVVPRVRAASPAHPAVTTFVATGTAPSRPARFALQPGVAMGRTDLGQDMFVERTADSIIVHFDTDTLRTRFDWKFEGIVRATLPKVFPQVETQLNGIPRTALVRGGDLLRDLPRTGVRLPVDATHALTIWPITRPGQDGPLVVAYRVSLSR